MGFEANPVDDVEKGRGQSRGHSHIFKFRLAVMTRDPLVVQSPTSRQSSSHKAPIAGNNFACPIVLSQAPNTHSSSLVVPIPNNDLCRVGRVRQAASFKAGIFGQKAKAGK